MLDLILEIAQTMRNNRLRTVLTGVAVSWGIFMLIVLLGAAKGTVGNFMNMTSDGSMKTINIWGGRTSKPYQGYKDGRRIDLSSSDIDAIAKDNPQVSSVMAISTDGSVKVSTSRDYVSGIQAVYPATPQYSKINIIHGRMLNDRDIADARRVMIIDDKNARLLFGDDSKAVGGTVKAMGLAWTVVGVYTHDWVTSNYIPYTTYNALTGSKDKPYQLTVAIEGMQNEADAEAAEAGIRATLAREHTFDKDDHSAVWTWNRFSNYLANLQGFTYLNIAVWVIGIFTLLSGIVGVSNIMFVSVRERTHEIGIRRAIGAKPRSILTQILAESVAITALFGYIGVVAGMVVLELIAHFVPEMSEAGVDLSLAAQVTVALIIAGATAGIFPAMKAIKVKPVEALRDE